MKQRVIGEKLTINRYVIVHILTVIIYIITVISIIYMCEIETGERYEFSLLHWIKPVFQLMRLFHRFHIFN